MLRDVPDEDRDALVSEHLAESFVAATKSDDDDGLERPLSKEAFRAYVTHARETVAPVVEDPEEVVTIATEHYQQIRADVDEDDPVTVSSPSAAAA